MDLKGPPVTGIITFMAGTVLGILSFMNFGQATVAEGILLQVAGLGMAYLALEAQKGGGE